MRAPLLVACLLLVVLPTGASAAVVSTEPINSCGSDNDCLKAQAGEPTFVVTVVGQPGERNGITITGSPDEVVVSDVTAPLQPGPGCSAAADATIHCPARRIQFYASPGLVALDVRLGDGNDDLVVFDGAVEAGVFDGGPGEDQIGIGGGGPIGRFPGRPVLRGGPGDDRLMGGAGADVLEGGNGEDVLEGFGGPDDLDGGRGGDRVVGGAGADRLRTRDRGAEEVDCGPGRDRVVADREDRPRRCEVRRYTAPR